ncbi:hypothetical protein IFM89_034291 [Coptis chinensis]|uniref:Uncharacterized protein n=1 Tax=Coptis chinensis TaxID=261450 RepID=A0A835M2Y9_9MAGN|nr:hypothetical protein IFM89_034291 [Coptis chinensis]
MAVTCFHDKLSTFLSDLWSWWWAGSNQKVELSTAVLTFFTVVLLLFWITWMVKESTKGKLPGPRGLPVLGNLLSLDPELHTYFAKLAQTYGPIYKLQLGNKLGVVISSPSIAKEVLKDHDTTFANRDVPAVAGCIAYGGKDIVWTPYGPEWRMLRKVCVREMLGNASLDAVYTLRQREVRRMVGNVYSKIGSPINVGEEMFLTVLNVITSMMWGGTIKVGEGASIGAEFREVVGDITDLLGKPNLSDFFPILTRLDLQGIQGKIGEMFKRFDSIFNSIIEQRLKMEDGDREDTKDFLQLMLKLKDDSDAKTPFTMVHLKALLMVRVFNISFIGS